MANNSNSTPKRMTFYATPDDQATVDAIGKLKPHYTYNLMIREGLALLLKKLQFEAEQPLYQIKNTHRIIK